MKLLLIFAGLFAMSLAAGPQQDAEVVFPPPSPSAEIWRDHLQKIDSEKLLLDGVPERYHYLYLIASDISEADIQKALPFTKIKLSRSRCLGFCPAYEVEFSATGEASYNGVAHTEKFGRAPSCDHPLRIWAHLLGDRTLRTGGASTRTPR